MESLTLHISCLFFVSQNDDITDIKKSDGICSSTFVVDDFSGLFLQPLIFYVKDLKSA